VIFSSMTPTELLLPNYYCGMVLQNEAIVPDVLEMMLAVFMAPCRTYLLYCPS
jgi:hypothetical protein